MTQFYEPPSVSVIYFVPLERLAVEDDPDRTRNNMTLPGDDFTPSLEDSVFG